LGRIAAMVVALAIGLVAVLAGAGRAATYEVAQCGSYVGADATWADTTGGAKFAPEASCAGPVAGAYLRTVTRGGGTVSGTRFGRWRWQAPPGTAITVVRGSWWHALHDGFQQRLGGDPGDGSFALAAESGLTELAPADFYYGFPSPQVAFEDRLLCAKPESKSCSVEDPSWSALRGLTLTLVDDHPPAAGIGGKLLEPGWHRGAEPFVFWSGDLGSGDRFQETLIDGARVSLTEYPCAIAPIEGEWRGLLMQPCPLGPSGAGGVDTTHYSDGVHVVESCSTDFAGNRGCSAAAAVAIDNNPPAHPRPVAIAGGEGWHRSNDFDLSWTDPDQGAASPIAGVYHRVTGANGYDSGVIYSAGGLTALANLTVPGPGAWNLHLWLADAAGNSSAATGIDVPLRFDDAPPSVAFAGGDESSAPDAIRAAVADPLAGPAGGTISYRKPDGAAWIDLPTKPAGEGPGRGTLVAPTPDLSAAGLYLFRVEALDGAGNVATSTLRADGTRMAIRRAPGPAGPGALGGARAKVRLFARLREGGDGGGVSGRNGSLTVPFGSAALVAGRLTGRGGAGLAGRTLRVVCRPSRGALTATARALVTTGKRGGFELPLAPGPSRRVDVYFAGGDGLAAARRAGLDLRVRSGVSLSADRTSLRTGETVALRGRVRAKGAPIPRRGKLVAIQYLEEATHRWRPVLVVRSDHGGRFHARYRFRYVSGAARIQLRATALAEERWPYAPGSSSPVTVDVDGH
jgi:hypothetical protein